MTTTETNGTSGATESSFEKARRKMVSARRELIGELAKFNKDEVVQQPAEGEWSALQIAHHLYIAEGLAMEQMQLVQSEDNPMILNVAQEAPHRTETSDPPVSLEAVLSGMAARREEMFEYLSNLPEAAWTRPFRHQEWGDRKFYQLVNVLPAHDQQHTQQLIKIKAALTE